MICFTRNEVLQATEEEKKPRIFVLMRRRRIWKRMRGDVIQRIQRRWV